MSDENQRLFERFYKLFVRFSFVSFLLGLAFLSFILINLMTRLHNMAPAELRLLFEILKNRFFR